MDQNKTRLSPYPPNYRAYPLTSNSLSGYAPPYQPILPSKPTLELGYWELLSPALFGIVGALFLSLFSGENNDDDHIQPLGGTLFKLVLLGYGIGATVTISLAINNVVKKSKHPHNHLLFPIGGGLIAVILLFTAEYLLLYRFIPSSFKGDIGDNLLIQFLSFLYFSITTLATANLGDILPTSTTARLLISTEIAFNLFTLATGIQLLLVQK